MFFKKLRPGDWFIFPEATLDSELPFMVKLEFSVQSANLTTTEPLTALSVSSGAFSTVTDDVKVIKVSRTLEELQAGDRFILADDLGRPNGVVIYRKTEMPSDCPDRPGKVFRMESEDGNVKITPPEGKKVIKIR
jgi:hypothetical protein